MEITTRKEAIKLGLVKYYDGLPCRLGHFDYRYLNGGCISCQKLRKKSWAKNNTEKKSYRNLKYRETHKEERTQYKRVYESNRRKSDSGYATLCRLRNRLNDVLRKQSVKKTTRIIDLIGCSLTVLIAHLEHQFVEGMTWENRHLWHIDHKRPCSSFDFSDPEQQRRCFHYTNLQPLWARDNILKGRN